MPHCPRSPSESHSRQARGDKRKQHRSQDRLPVVSLPNDPLGVFKDAAPAAAGDPLVDFYESRPQVSCLLSAPRSSQGDVKTQLDGLESRSRSVEHRLDRRVDDDLLGLFKPDSGVTLRESPGRRGCVTDTTARDRAICDVPKDEGKYWSVDQQGRPFRLPYTPSDIELERASTLGRRISHFVGSNHLEDRVGRMMHNMNPDDIDKVMQEGDVPHQCRNPNAVVVSRIRRIEKNACRPNAMKRYDNDRRFGRSRTPSRGRRRLRGQVSKTRARRNSR